ncbi:Cyanovirin-N [Thozetella sp. PMI_491]|nr:Cyanovirin-N [Thozetella sp. PMI_491]
MRFSLLGLATAALAPSLVLAGGASQSCSLAWIGPSGVRGDCKDGSGSYHWGIEDLNLCVGNNRGYLVAQDNGGFAGSCSDCTGDGSLLWCTCGDGWGGNVRTSVNLDDFLTNESGWLWCFGHRGT